MIRQQDRLPKVRVRDPAGHDGLKRWADAVAEKEGVLLGQVQDPGRGRHAPGRAPYAIGPSSLPDDLSWTMPDALDHSAIMQLVEEFAQSCAVLDACGFGGCEISAGHGHLFHQFLSPRSNQRDDDYGGDLAGRTRLLRELISAIRAACGTGFIIGLKLPGEDGVRGSIDPDQAAGITRMIVQEAPPDYLLFRARVARAFAGDASARPLRPAHALSGLAGAAAGSLRAHPDDGPRAHYRSGGGGGARRFE